MEGENSVAYGRLPSPGLRGGSRSWFIKTYAMVCHIIALKDAYCERGLSDYNNVKTYY